MRSIYLTLSAFIILVFSFLGKNEDVQVIVTAPTQVEAGASFTVRITIIKKDKIANFARFVSLLPNGMKAQGVETHNAIFTFKERMVKFLWLPGSLPQKDTFSISYKVFVDTSVVGNVFIQNQFIYVKNNERKTKEVKPIEITINNPYKTLANNYNPGDTFLVAKTENELNINNKNPNNGKYNNSEQAEKNINKKGIYRQVSINGNVATITVTINKNGVGGSFAKVEEKLPSGFEAIADKDAGGIYTFTDHTAKFLWSNFPKDTNVTVVYKVMKKDASNISKDELAITGKFSYLQGTNTNAGQESSTQENKILAQQQASNNNGSDIQKQNIEDVAQKKQEQHTQSYTKQTSNVQKTSPIFFRVQVCALKQKKRSIRYIKRIYKIKKKMYLENHLGWRKYTVGHFDNYQNARNYRNILWNNTPAKDAFISAYNGGKRITVQEALMIAHQKWIQ